MRSKDIAADKNKVNSRRCVPKLRFPIFQDSGEWNQDRLGNCFSERIKKNNHDKQVLAATQDKGVIPYESLERSIIRNTENLDGYKLVLPGDFVISLRSFEGGFEFSSSEGIISPAYTILHSDIDIDSDFFCYYFKRPDFIKQIQRTLNSSLRDGKTINYRQASELQMSLPSKAEQTKIAECLSSLDELITAHMNKLEILRAYKKGLMQRLFPSEEKTIPKLRFPEFKNAQKWERKTLKDIATVTSGGTPSRSKREFWQGNIPWVTTSLIDFNTIISADEFITELGLSESSAKVFPKNTVLMAMYGQGKTRGKVALLGIESATNQACAAIIPNEGINPKFAFYYLANRYDEIRNVSNSGGQENLSASLIEGLNFAYPVSIVDGMGEQEKIVEYFSSLDSLISAQSAKIDALKEHKKGLMQQLFPSLDEATS